jgi:hypothetical protein
MQAMTLPDVRDAVRIALGLPIALDTPGGAPGDPGSMPRPNNALINRVFNLELAKLDGLKPLSPKRNYTLPIAAVSGHFGPLEVSLNNDGWQPRPGYAGLMQLYSAWWQYGATQGNAQPITVTTRAQLEVEYRGNTTEREGQPLFAWMDHTLLFVYPAPQVSGSLLILAREGVAGVSDDSEIITALPANVLAAFCDIGALKIAKATPDDVEMRTRAQMLEPEAAVARGIVARWVSAQNAGNKHGFNVPYMGRY